MPIISKIGRRHPRTRALIGAIYFILIAGAVTMVYPFLIMIAGSAKSQVDAKYFRPFPGFLSNDQALYRKHLEGLFNERLLKLKVAYDLDASSFESMAPPEGPQSDIVALWNTFIRETDLPDYTYFVGYMHTPLSMTQPRQFRSFKQSLIEQYGNDIDRLNTDLETEFVNWNAFSVRPEFYLPRRNKILTTPFFRTLRAFKESVPHELRYYFMVEGFYKTEFLKTQYTRDVAEYNRTHGTSYISYDDIRLTRHVPQGTDAEKQDWETFVRHTLNLLWIRVDESAAPAYREFLKAKYRTVDALNKNHHSTFTTFEDIALIEEPPSDGIVLSDWDAWISGWKDPETGRIYAPAVEALRIHSVEFMFEDFCKGQAAGIKDNLPRFRPPQREAHYAAFQAMKRDLRWEFSVRNYIKVLDYMLLHGRGIVNTAIYCALAVLLALLVNPLAAYALSRYRPANTYKILLFMLLTMAFPPMVTQIPVFLMLRDFDLLNTFAALVLPGMAHGYSIFLLKGFFDSLPRDLYESAQMDGANEWTLFWTITMSLSKPILAVIALSAFTAAYSNFMFALLLCQDESMWTLMVWLFQLQQQSGPGVVYASLIIAAIPTFIIFVFCQNIIMRGIVVPVEK